MEKLTLKAIRVNKGLTQRQAAKLIGIAEPTLVNYEKGRSFPDVPVINKIQEVYQIKYDNINFLCN